MYLTRNLSKSPFYQILYKNENGKFTTFSTGQKSKSDALKALADFKDTLNKKSDTQPVTLKEFESEYLQLVKSIRSKSYIRSIESSFKKLYEYTGNIYLNKLDYRILERFITSNYNDSKFAAALYYRTLKAAFEKAREWNYIQENPLKKFHSPKLPKTLPIFININELNKILKHTNTRLMKDLFLTAFYTGLRLGELVNMKWTAIDLKRRMIKVQNTNQFTTKNKKERIIPVNDTLNKIILNRLPKNNHSNNDEFVFCKVPGISLNTDFVSKTFKKAVRKSGLNNRIHFHSLRHSFASNLVQNGVSLYLVKELLGHQDIITTQIYAHIKNENLFDAVKVLDRKNSR